MHRHLTTRGRRRGPRCMAALIAATLAGSALIPTAAAATPAGLAITLTGPAAQVRSHSSVTYTATITNTTADLFTGRLVLTVPGYLTITAATGGTPTAHTVTWAIDVPADSAITRAATARIGPIPDGTQHVTSLATIYHGTSTASPPLIRAAHSDMIAGVIVPPAATQLVHRIPHERGPSLLAVLPLVVGAVLLTGGALWLWQRRRQRVEPVDDASNTLLRERTNVSVADTDA